MPSVALEPSVAAGDLAEESLGGCDELEPPEVAGEFEEFDEFEELEGLEELEELDGVGGVWGVVGVLALGQPVSTRQAHATSQAFVAGEDGNLSDSLSLVLL